MNTTLPKCLTIVFIFLLQAGYAQNTWTQKANFGGTSRRGAVGFSIGSKGYCGIGFDGTLKNDFWEYNPANNSWTQKANFGGTAREGAVGFSIGTKGYLGTGGNSNDFWEYNPSNNSWTQKAPYGGPPCTGAVGFSIGSKGYIGTGSFSNIFYNDFWEYDPITNVWSQKASFGGGARAGATGFVIGNKGYIGNGVSGINHLVDFWEYDPSLNSWIQKANVPTNAFVSSSGFSIGTKGYLCGGSAPLGIRYNDLWEYNPFTDSWVSRLNYPGPAMGNAIAFTIGNKGYVGTGDQVTGFFSNLFFEYSPIPSLITEPLNNSPFCAGNSLAVSYTTTTTYNNGNTFAAQLSDAFGNFANAVTIGSITATNSGSIPCVIPANTPAGSAYRIRVVSSLPIDIGPDNGSDLVICSVTWPVSLSPVCSNGLPVALSGGMPAGGTYSGPGVDAFGNFDPSQVVPGVYTLAYSLNSALGCFCAVQNTITVRALPSVTWPVSFSPVCGNASSFLLNGGLPSGGTYSGPGVDAFGNFSPSQVPFGTTTLTYTYSDAFGCTNTTTNTINVINCFDCGACYTPDTNQIINGNFNSGNFGFSSGLPNNCICDVGSYCVTTDSYLKCTNFFHVNDHTSGTGNYLVVDGSTSNNVNIWMQQVSVTSGKSYTLSFWIHPEVSHISYNPILNVSINNVSLGIVNTAMLPKQWNNLFFSWTSNLTGTPFIRILQTNGSDPGTDYGIDDISFYACIPNVIANAGPDREICEGDTVHLSGNNNLLTNNWYKINTGNPANYPFLGTGSIVVEPENNTCYLLIACDGICCDTDTVCIDVNQKPIVTWPIAYADVCQNNAPIHLIDGLPLGGIYSGQGVSGNYFDPSTVNPGSYILTYTYTDVNGCTNFITNTITVLAPPVVLWDFSYAPACSDLPPFALGGGMPAGGVYSGTGVDISGFFHPASVPFGLSLIYYTYTDANGCSTTITDTIEVIHCVPCGPCYSPGPDLIVNGNFELGNTGFSSNLPVACSCTFGSYCVTTSSFNKCNVNYNITDHTSGSGNYLVIDGDQFIPNKEVWKEFVTVSNGLNYKLSFWLHPSLSNGTGRANLIVIINNQVQYNITGINVPNQWTNFTISWLSNTNGSIPVSIVQTNFGGNGYDYGIDDISFNGCIPLGVEANAGNDTDICAGSSVNLQNFSGQTCDWYIIEPANPGNVQYAGTGNITVTPLSTTYYMLVCCNAACCDTDTVVINVHHPIVTWPGAPDTLCRISSVIQLTGGLPLGGVYAGPGVSGVYFNPQGAVIGNNILTYTYTDAFGCSGVATHTIHVLAPPVVTWPVVYAPVCQPGPAVQFSGGQPPGGIYVPSGGLFQRLNSHYGINTYDYFYTDENGCINSASNSIQFIYCIDCGPCSTPGSNQIVNGDFSAGNTGFTSDLAQSCSCNNGTFCVATNNQNKCANIINGGGDHTSGNGKYLVIEGSPLANQDVWKQNTQVILGRTYHFTFWMGSLEPFFHRPNSDFEIRFNNQVVQTIPAAQMPSLDWAPFTFTWVSNINSNSMPIAIRQVSGLTDSMDYGIDDIFFNECVPNFLINAGLDDTICSGTSTQLSANIPGPYNTITWSPANGLSCTNCLNPVASPAATTTYSLIVTTADGCTYSDLVVVTVISCAVDLNIKLFIQGYYKGSGIMTAVSTPSSLPLLCDSIEVELHETYPPYSIAYSTTATILVNGDRTFSYPPGIFGNSYYIAIKHRNTLETWSALPVLFNSTVINYDFSNAQNKAFGNNLADLGDGTFALYSGDVNQNGIIDYDDYDFVKDASKYFYTGYIVEDLTGDWILESADFSLIENNIGRIIMRP